MNTINKYSRFVIVIVLLLVVSQLAFAQDNTGIPQWVIDRQQYETTFVYAPNIEPAPKVPQWVIDRQQYETTFVYAPNIEPAPKVPQWVVDRQVYETTFVYPPSEYPRTMVVFNPSHQ